MGDVLKHYDGTGYTLHAYVVMRDHLHVLLTPAESIEKSVQLIKGGFSFRIKREFAMQGDVWQQGFTDHRIRDSDDWERHLKYIRMNPVEARLVQDSAMYEWMGFPNVSLPQGLKPLDVAVADVRAEARTLLTDTDVRAEARTLLTDADVRAEARMLRDNEHTDGVGVTAPFESDSAGKGRRLG
jgi:REP element-mobilizing transposase RayT